MSDENERDDLTQRLIELLDTGVNVVMGEYPKRPDFIVGSTTPNRPGSKPVLCDGCGETLYITDGHKLKERYPDVPVICLPCATAQARKWNG